MTAKACRGSLSILWQVSELDSVVGEHGVDAVRNSFDERSEERDGGPRICFFDEFDDGELRGAVDGYEQVELAFGGPHLGQVDMEEADRMGIELLPLRHVPFHVRQTADAVTLQTSMKGRASELRDRGQKCVEAVIQRQQRVFAKRNDNSLLLDRKNRRSRMPGLNI